MLAASAVPTAQHGAAVARAFEKKAVPTTRGPRDGFQAEGAQ